MALKTGMIISTLCSTPQFQIGDCLIHCAQNFRILFINYHMNRVCSFLCLALKEERIMPVVTGEPAGKAFFDYRCMKMKLGGQYSGKWSISPIYVSKPLITVFVNEWTSVLTSFQFSYRKFPYQASWKEKTCANSHFIPLQHQNHSYAFFWREYQPLHSCPEGFPTEG